MIDATPHSSGCWLCGAQPLAAFPALPQLGDRSFTYQHCRACGLARLTDGEVRPDLADFYQAEYQPVCGEFATGRRSLLARLLQANFHRLGRHIEALVPKGRLLDVGCGAGVFLAVMRERGWQASGLEPNQGLVEQLQLRRGLDVVAGTLEQVPDDWGGFDVVSLFHVVEHLPDPRSALDRVRRLLRPGGIVVVVTPNVASLEHRLFGRCWYALQPPDHVWLFSGPSLARLLAGVGLETVAQSLSPVSYAWPSLRRLARLPALPGAIEAAGKLALAVPMRALVGLTGAPAELEVYARRSA